MRKFRFKLEKLHEYRKLLTGEEKTRLAREVGKLTKIEQQGKSLREIKLATQKMRIRGLSEGLYPGEIINLHEHLLRVDETIADTDKKIVVALQDVEKARLKLIERRKDEIVVESLKKRIFKRWLRDYYRDDGKTLDDIGNIQYYLARQKKG